MNELSLALFDLVLLAWLVSTYLLLRRVMAGVAASVSGQVERPYGPGEGHEFADGRARVTAEGRRRRPSSRRKPDARLGSAG